MSLFVLTFGRGNLLSKEFYPHRFYCQWVPDFSIQRGMDTLKGDQLCLVPRHLSMPGCFQRVNASSLLYGALCALELFPSQTFNQWYKIRKLVVPPVSTPLPPLVQNRPVLQCQIYKHAVSLLNQKDTYISTISIIHLNYSLSWKKL